MGPTQGGSQSGHHSIRHGRCGRTEAQLPINWPKVSVRLCLLSVEDASRSGDRVREEGGEGACWVGDGTL
eukprot:7383279-Prymnesium_polylepis.1